MKKFVKLNHSVIFRLSGWLLAIDSIFMLIAVIGGYLQDGNLVVSFLIIAILTAIFGISLAKSQKPERETLTLHDALFLTAFTWISFSIVGAIPFIFGNHAISFIDAFFESSSGYTSTGASVINDVESLPSALLLWRSITQWVGGVGIIIFSLAVIPMLSCKESVRLFNAEVSGLTSKKFRPRISQTAKGTIYIYSGLTLAMTILLWIGPMNFFDAINQAMTTLSTGGFSTRNASMAAWDSSYVYVIAIIFMFIGGVNLQLMYWSFLGHPRQLLKNDTFRFYGSIVICVSLFVVLSRYATGHFDGISSTFITSSFTVVSAISSTGFSCINFEPWGTEVLFALLIIMFFGACAGSTTSGAKTDRLIFLIKNTRNSFYKTIHPNHLPVVRVNGQIISHEKVSEVIGFLSIYVVIVVLCSMIIAAFGLSLQDSLFASISCMSNIGLGYGATGAGGSFASLPDISKIVLSLEMLIGRLEIFTFVIIFLPIFWRR